MLDAKAERAVLDASRLLQSIFGSRLVTVALHGSAAGSDYVSGVSDLNLVAVVDEIGPADLRAVREHVGAWRKNRIATPLLLDRRFLRDAADVFPMELHDIREQHRVLHGNDVFADLEIRDEHLRYQCEHEARGKLLRLRELYLEIGDDRGELEALILDSLKTFLILMRNLCRSDGAPAPAGYRDVLATFSARFGRAFPVLSRLLEVRLGAASFDDDVEATFASYLGELQQLIDVIDRLPPGTPRAAALHPPSHQP